jgi:hypothetical protein
MHTQAESAGVLARVRTPFFTSQRERGREREIKREGERVRERDKERG